MPRASVIVPTWNGSDLLAAALASLAAQRFRDLEVVVVDNGSTDGTLERLAREFPEVRCVSFSENRGFAAAVNAGIVATRGEIIALLNNDAEADPGWLESLVTALEAHPEAAACASKVLYYDDRRRVDSAGVQFGIYASQIGHGEPDGAEFGRRSYVFGASGGAAAYRRSALDDVGVFDERYFAYFEDVDLAARLQLAGYSCVYAPAAVVYHRVSATSRRMPATRFYLLMRNSLYLFFQNMPPRRLVWAPLVLSWPFIRAGLDRQPLWLAARAVFDFVRDFPEVRRRRAERAARRRISWSDFASRLAPPLTRQRHTLRPLGGSRV